MARKLTLFLLPALILPCFSTFGQQDDYYKRRRHLTENNWEDENFIYREGTAAQAESGYAVFYADYLHGQSTAMGEIYSMYEMTCAHKTHGKGTLLKVTRTDNNKSVTVRVNDRGAYSPGVIIDVSRAAAEALDLIRPGKAAVRVTVVGFSDTNPPVSPQARRSPAAYDTQPGNFTAKGLTQRSPAPDAYEVRTLPAGQAGYAVQVASYRELDNAQRQVVALQQRGLSNVFVKEDLRTGERLFKIVIGYFGSRLDAQRHLDQLRAGYGMDGFVLNFR